jgi:hypothetical protein
MIQLASGFFGKTDSAAACGDFVRIGRQDGEVFVLWVIIFATQLQPELSVPC